jgi:hypothetical protein
MMISVPCARQWLLFAAVFFAVSSANADTLTYPDLVHRLTDLEHLAVLPPPGEKTALASSYDRKSQYDPATDKYINWDANDDGHGFIREEGDTQVLADIHGAGCIWRLWTAMSDEGHLKIYLDGATTPTIDLPFNDFYNNRQDPFKWPHLNGAAADATPDSQGVPGLTMYIPIPFAKSCRITGDKPKAGVRGWGEYFQATYTLFAPGTVVPTFHLPISAEDKAALDEADAKLARAGQDIFGPYPNPNTQTTPVTVPAGQTTTAANLTGEGAITTLKVKLDLPKDAEAQRALLRQLTIRISWDGEAKPSVWAPLGDFFGTVGGSCSFSSLPVGLADDGTFYSNWYMPFASGAKIEFGNDSAAPVQLALSVTRASLDRPIGDFGRLHVKWHRDAFNPTRPDRKPDWTMVTTQGRGRFVGVLLHIWNPNGGWWGEGDDKFFIDGEKFPSSFGTGSEDYIGYGWGSPNRFIRPFYGQPLNEGNLGHVAVYRWHIADQAPFQTSFEGDIEKYFSNQPGGSPYDEMSLYAATGFWYLAPGGTDPYEPIPVDQRVGYWTRPTPKYIEPGVIEGESMQTVTHPAFAHWPVIQMMTPWQVGMWSNDRIMMWETWQNGPTGEHMELKLPVGKAGKYHLLARLAKSERGGLYQLSLDDQKLGGTIDLYAPVWTPDPVDLGTFDLTAGDHVLKIAALGKEPIIPSNGIQFGLDYVKLVPVP